VTGNAGHVLVQAAMPKLDSGDLIQAHDHAMATRTVVIAQLLDIHAM
jgi:hypothetical protein